MWYRRLVRFWETVHFGDSWVVIEYPSKKDSNEWRNNSAILWSEIRNWDPGRRYNRYGHEKLPFCDSDFTKGFIQGIIYASHTTVDEPSLPLRYLTALQQLSEKQYIHISPADKGGGILIQNLTDYNSKMENLLQDTTTYEPVSLKTLNDATDLFTKNARKLLKNEDKKWTRVVNYHPKIPKMHGLPKTHKPRVPHRPILQ